MKKIITSLCVFLHLSFVYSQVGVNTTTPKTTFDVNAKRDPSGTIVDNNQLVGFQAPRMSRLELTNNTATYGLEQKGALIFITDISGGTAIGQRINITIANNYYYFDGTLWQRIADSNLYKDNGTLISNRTVAQADKTLAFTNTATSGTSHFTVDGTTLNVDAVNNRIGVNTDTPTAKIDVVGEAGIVGASPIRARNMKLTNTTDIDPTKKKKLTPVVVDEDGVMYQQYPISRYPDSYYFDGEYSQDVPSTNPLPVSIIDEITYNTVVSFKFMTDLSFGNSNSGLYYGQISFTVNRGFQVSNDWNYSGNSSSGTASISGVGTNTLDFQTSSIYGALQFTYVNGVIYFNKVNYTGNRPTRLRVFDGLKLR